MPITYSREGNGIDSRVHTLTFRTIICTVYSQNVYGSPLKMPLAYISQKVAFNYNLQAQPKRLPKYGILERGKLNWNYVIKNQTLHNQTKLTDENKIRNMKIELGTQHHLELC